MDWFSFIYVSGACIMAGTALGFLALNWDMLNNRVSFIVFVTMVTLWPLALVILQFRTARRDCREMYSQIVARRSRHRCSVSNPDVLSGEEG